MELRQLEMFVAVAERGSVTLAAEALHVAQPSVSARLRALESEIGYPLFDRLPRGVRLTEVGEAILPHARRILREVAEIGQAVDDLAGLRRGRLVLGTMPTLSAYVIPTVIKSFRSAFPEVELQVIEARASVLIEGVDAHRLDLALVSYVEPHPSIEAIPLFDEELFAILALDDPLAGRDEIDLRDLADRPFVVLEPGFELRTILWDGCRQAGFTPRIAQEMESIQAIKALVEIGMGVSVVPRAAVAQEERLGLLRAVRVRSPRLYRPLQIVARRGAYHSRAAQAFIQICREQAAAHRAG